MSDPEQLHPTTLAMLLALREGTAPSRNADFELHQDPHVRRAVEIHRLLESVVADVNTHADHLEVSVVDQAHPRYALKLTFPEQRGARTVYLSAFELKLLGEHAPAVTHLLSRRLDGASS